MQSTPAFRKPYTLASRARWLAVGVGLGCVPSALHAQTPPGQLPPVPPSAAVSSTPTATASRPQSFVLVAMTGEEAVDQHLRATADELHRRLGARGFADVDPAKVSQGIAADPSALGTLRSRLGAACMVRVDIASRTADHMTLAITVQTDAGEKTAAVYAAYGEILAKVIEAVEPMLPPAVAAPPPAVPVALDRVVLNNGTSIDCTVLGVEPGNAVLVRTRDGQQRTLAWGEVAQILPRHAAGGSTAGWSWTKGGGEDRRPEPPAQPSGDWDKRGGSLLTFDVQAQLAGMLVKLEHPYRIQYPDGQKMQLTGMSPSGGGGGGLAVHVGFLQLFLPNPEEHNALWGLSLGTGLEVAAIAFGYRTDSLNIVGQYGSTHPQPDQQEGGETRWTTAYSLHLPLIVGGQVGLGHFESGRSWHGMVLGLEWRPTYTYAKPGDLEAISSFNYLGVGLHLDVGSIDATHDGPEGNFRVSAVFLPTIDDHASYASLGFGAVWY
jgi:hypothetical protein